MDRKQQDGWTSEIARKVKQNCIKSWHLFVSQLKTNLTGSQLVDAQKQECEDKKNEEVEDQTLHMQCDLYSSQIHQQIIQQQNKQQKQINQDKAPATNQIQEIIEIYQSKLNQSPLKTNRSKINNKSQAREHPSPKSTHQRRLQIQKQKQQVEEHLRRLNQQMKIIKQKDKEVKDSKKYLENYHNMQASQQAHKMLQRIQKQKAELREKKAKDQAKLLTKLQKQAQRRQLQRREQIEKMKEQKKLSILKKMQDKKRARQEKMLINKQSNILIQQLKKSGSLIKDKSGNLLEKKPLQMKRNFSQRKEQSVKSKKTFLTEQQPKQIKSKSKIQYLQKQSQESMPKPIVHYPKGRFLQAIQLQDKKRKQLEKQKEQGKKQALQKRMKYGQLINNLFIPTSKNKSSMMQSRIKPPTPDAPINPRPKPSLPRSTQEQVYKGPRSKQKINQNRQPSDRGSYISSGDRSEEKLKKQQERQVRLRQLRKQTLMRMKKAQQKQQQMIINSRNVPKITKYSDYLKQLPKHKQPSNNWKKILQNSNLSKQQKYAQLLSKANILENKAKLKSHNSKGDDETMNLIIGSIQAKLALLDEL